MGILEHNIVEFFSEDTLLAHRVFLPISRDTAWHWMVKCDATHMETQKTYYNDHNENPEVIEFRTIYIETIKKLQKCMRVWKVLSVEEEQKYITMRKWSSFENAIPLGEIITTNGLTKYVHYMDD